MIIKIVKVFIVLLCMFTIFMLSADDNNESNKKSDGLIIKACKILVRKDLSEKEQQAYIDKYVTFVRKSAHFTIYLLLGLSIISLIKEYRQIDIKSLIIALIISVLYAVSDEIHQILVPGRSGEIRDVLIDSIGSLTGIYLYYLFYKIRRKKYE